MTRAILAVLAVAGLSAAATLRAETPDSALQAQAKLTEAQARRIALDKVPLGTVQSSELEQEGGRLIWSLDVTSFDSTDVTEVSFRSLAACT